jgi:hypothetical protein
MPEPKGMEEDRGRCMRPNDVSHLRCPHCGVSYIAFEMYHQHFICRCGKDVRNGKMAKIPDPNPVQSRPPEDEPATEIPQEPEKATVFPTETKRPKAISEAARIAAKEYKDKYYQDHREEILKQRDAYYKINVEKERSASKKYYYAHREKVLARVKEHYEANKIKISEQRKQRRLRVKSLQGLDHQDLPGRIQGDSKAIPEGNQASAGSIELRIAVATFRSE